MSDLDVLVLGDADPDPVLSGDAAVRAFGQAQRLGLRVAVAVLPERPTGVTVVLTAIERGSVL